MTMVAPVMALETPFMVGGYINYEDGSTCNGPWVHITNTNTGAIWDAENSSTSNYYLLVLTSGDVSVNDVLQLEASEGSQSKTVEHTVTQDDIDAGGLTEDIMLESKVVFYPIITSCNSTGAEKDMFTPDQVVNVGGSGLLPETIYNIWIQDDQVNENDPLVADEDPSESPETVTTDTNGDFEKTPIWSIPEDAKVTHHSYDIVVDDGDNIYNAGDDGIDSADVAGIVAPVPELTSFSLVSAGLLGLFGLILKKRH